ncbi:MULTISPECIES: DUF4160 domain-containing protein [unclassified Aureimonas]|uniref:DUF4160 domain-containing protein n=1 Tax=unclassified Aureimonas TaxID=2615206 RepID=UPI0006F86E32|nr:MULTISPECIES: DUF4160 domain-containing protein [unclassified Aureimonas]KQT55302.1 hypothetical protein ASG62_10795 [Aureimonas sp. Leaf427]KQT71093.1 hypothetical protein ASG54_21180 [Aureimonas sp. Leaf460]
MVTVLREAGLRIVIYLDDHEPAHVHAYGDGEARIDLVRLRVLSQRGMTRRELAKTLSIVTSHHEFLLRKWTEIHG